MRMRLGKNTNEVTKKKRHKTCPQDRKNNNNNNHVCTEKNGCRNY